MERRDFLANLGQASVFVCAGSLLAACSKSSSTPGNGGGNNNGPLLTANLDNELTSVGSFKRANTVFVIRIADGNTTSAFDAFSLVCTHQGCTVNWDGTDSTFKCPCHGSEYDGNGNVIQGPAPSALHKYKISISGNTLTVS